MSRTILDATISKNPIRIPDDSDIAEMEKRCDRLAKDIESQESLNKAKENPDFQRIMLDSYLSMQMIERAAMRLDPKKPDFALNFAGLQGRWRERLSLTEEIVTGKARAIGKKNLLVGMVEKLKSLKAKINMLTSKIKM